MPKGHTNNPNGRPRGAVGKATSTAREAIALFVEGNSDRLTTWLDAIAADNPKDAFTAFMSVVEYHIPKLARQELVGAGGKDLTIQIVKLGDDPELLEKQRLNLNDKSDK